MLSMMSILMIVTATRTVTVAATVYSHPGLSFTLSPLIIFNRLCEDSFDIRIRFLPISRVINEYEWFHLKFLLDLSF